MQQFKVGDWVRHKESNNIYQVKGFSIHGQTKGFLQVPDEYNLLPSSECELWQPKEGEWVIPNTKTTESFSVFRYTKNYKGLELQPFIGELPSFLK